ncbi:DUF4870 domain-containing protein [Natronoarchaeum mannanilyticum]|uniref:DUF4870 domain-containing protein n=1 Tax=Natronoarchaeum mannanilyticum TaxID=926360 RepID=A0AAV3T969_9EURY
MGQTETTDGETSILAVVVHLFGLFYSVVGAGIVYLLASDEFTKTNARNALNWHIFFLVVATILGGLALAGLGGALGALLVLGVGVLVLLDTAFCIWATYKAVDGTAWTYPIAPEFV